MADRVVILIGITDEAHCEAFLSDEHISRLADEFDFTPQAQTFAVADLENHPQIDVLEITNVLLRARVERVRRRREMNEQP